jgi:serine phosphatase RsbU (regulator of sigma subunit)
MRHINLLFFSLIYVIQSAYTQSYNYRIYTTEDGLLDNKCYNLFQDANGYLWIANGNGVSKFNGKRFDNIVDNDYKEGLANISNFITYNNGKELLINTSKTIFNLTRKKYVIKDSTFVKGFDLQFDFRYDIDFKSILDKNLYKVYSANKRAKESRDTIYFSFEGKHQFVLLPNTKNNSKIKILNDSKNNCFIKVKDTLSNLYHYFLFNKGRLQKLFESKDDYFKIESDHKNNFLCFNWDNANYISFYDYKGKFIKKISSRLWKLNSDFDCVIDKDNCVWIATEFGIIKIDQEKKVNEYFDYDRNVFEDVAQLVDPSNGNGILFKYTVSDNYCRLIQNAEGIFINGDRIFDGGKFHDIIDYSILSNLFNGKIKGKNIRQIIADREKNIWMATDFGLIKFTPAPLIKPQDYKSKNLFDFKLKHTDATGRKFYVNEDAINRKFTLRIYKDTILLFNKVYFKSNINDSYSNSDNMESLEFYSFGNKTGMFYNSKKSNYEIVIFEDKELKSYSSDDNLTYLCNDSENLYLKSFTKGLLLKVNHLEKKVRQLDNFWDQKINYVYNSKNLENFNKVLASNLRICNINSDLTIDTLAYGNLPTPVRYNVANLIPIKLMNFNMFIYEKNGNIYLASPNKHVQLKCDFKIVTDLKDNRFIDYNKALKWGEFILLMSDKQLLTFKFDSTNFELKYHKTFNHQNGLPSIDNNDCIVFGDYLILYRRDNNFIKLVTLKDFIKDGLENPIDIKLNSSIDLYTFFNSKNLKFNSEFFNKKEPIINIYNISYGYDGKVIMDTVGNYVYPASINNLSFKFDAVSLTEGDFVKVRYNLLGFDSTWVDISNLNEIKFTSLPPGTYTLQIKACNNHNYWNTECKKLIFTIDFPWYRTWIAYFGFIVSGVGLIYALVKNKTKKLEKEKIKLEETVLIRTNEIAKQKYQIEEKNKEITDSINYAQKIQRTLMATETYLDKYLKNDRKDYFVYYQPKDIVSGDYYWAHESNDEFILLTADCTGHGVPGAFMSLLCISYLNEIVKEKKVNRPDFIFNQVRDKIVANFKVDENPERKDGMDAVICSFNFKTNLLTYCAGNNPIIVVEPNDKNEFTLIELEYDKMPVGVTHDGNYKPFTNYTFQLKNNSVVYTFTDGFADQFGGPKGKKFMYKQLRNILLEIHHLPMSDQKQKLNNILNSWRGDLEQVDDICVIGVRV